MKRKTQKSRHYADLMGYRCANPNCEYGFGIEGHHIQPMSLGGEDRYQNIISLCSKCHRSFRRHRNWEMQQQTLLIWKFIQEGMLLEGLMSDMDDTIFARKAAKILQQSGRTS